MVFYKYVHNKNGSNRRFKHLLCSECGTEIKAGDVFYSYIKRRAGKNLIEHLCEACYEKKWIVA